MGPLGSPVCLAFLALLRAPGPQGGREEVEWFRSGAYVGLSGGVMNARASGADLDDALGDLGWVTETTLDETDFGWKVRVGYRFEAPWALELGYADLGTVESEIEAMPADPDAFLRDLAREHPSAGQGLTLAGEFYLADTARLDVGLRGGLWLWESDIDASAPGGASFNVERDGLDPLFGFSVLVRLCARLRLRAEYERYYVDRDDVGFASLGVELRLR